MDKLTPTARMTRDALQTGPGNVHELCERTRRSRSATDKALAELAKAGLIAKADDGGDTAGGAPTRWRLAEQAEPEGPEATIQPDAVAEAVTVTGTATSELPASTEPDDQPVPQETAPSNTGPEPDAEVAPGPEADPGPGPDSGTPAEDVSATGNRANADAKADADAKPNDDKQHAEAEEPKLCRGCQSQMPKICPKCWQKTPTYCGNCRKTMPQVRRGEPGEPIILSNGLPKLRPGELEALVQKVMQDNSLPHHVGVTGWTPGRVAIFLPRRSPGAIANALRKLTNTGVAELIGDRPERFQLKATDGADTNADKQHEAAIPVPDTAAPAAVEPADQQAGEPG